MTHAGPAEQDCTPTWQVFPPGMHCAPGEQATQAPLPSQTPLAPPEAEQDVPAAAAVPWSVHVGAPAALHAVTLPM